MFLQGFSWRTSGTTVLAAGAVAVLAACTTFPQQPVEVQQSNPTVTYNYSGDEELIAANQKAATHCSRYGAVAQTVSITDNTDGTKSVMFECIPSAQVTATTMPNPNMSYTVRTDQELLQASTAANTYCSNQSRRAVTSNISPNVDGTRTVTFQCVPA